MRLMAFGGDTRMIGLLESAKQAGWDTVHVTKAEQFGGELGSAQAVVLPWPRSFREELLVTAQENAKLSRARVLACVPPCRVVLAGGDVHQEELAQAQRLLRPERDEPFLRKNARLTAEGAMLTLLSRRRRALLSSTVLVLGFGRIGQEMVLRLTPMGAFVIVCARNEEQMRLAHRMGAHPVPLSAIDTVCKQADVLVNTIPAQVLGERTLLRLKREVLVLELASAPYGLDLKSAQALGIELLVESGIPGRYAPMEAGAALFDMLLRAMTEEDATRRERDE